LVHIQQTEIAQMSSLIFGVAGYYSETDCTQHLGGMQHVVVATTDGILHEMHWNQYTPVTSPQPLKRSPGSAPLTFPGIHSLSGFYTCDDHTQHVVVATNDGRLHEVYFTDSQRVNVRSPLLDTIIPPETRTIGQAGFYTSDGDNLRHVTVGGADSFLHEVVWNAQLAPKAKNLATQFTLPHVAAIAGFFDLSVHSRDVIVAMQGGDVFDVHYSGGILAGGQITTDRVKTFPSLLVNVAAFVDTNSYYRHVIALHESGQLYDYRYSAGQASASGQQTSLVSIPDVRDIVAYYSHYDAMCHVIVATKQEKKVYEVYYS
jgi:hypothetical protein